MNAWDEYKRQCTHDMLMLKIELEALGCKVKVEVDDQEVTEALITEAQPESETEE